MLPVVVISGPSGVGKNTIIQELLRRRNDVAYSVSLTSRKPRPGEKNGEHYFFVSPALFQKMIQENQLLEWTHYLGHYYGTSRQKIQDIQKAGKFPLLDLDTQGALNLKKTQENIFTIFIMPPNMQTLKERLLGRGTDSPEKIQERLQKAQEEIALKGQYDFVVINQDFKQAASAIEKKLNGFL